MRKNIILEEIKNEIREKIDRLSFENLEMKQEEIRTFIDFLHLLDKLPFEIHQNYQEENTISHPVLKDKTIQPSQEETKEIFTEPVIDENSNVGRIFRFERKLRGGVIPELDNGYIIPEKMVRHMNADDGDMVRVTSEKGPEEHKSYHFEVVEKRNSPNKSRVELKFCNVEKEAGEFVVKEAQGRMIKLDEVPYTFVIREGDVDNFHLHEGDLIDIAYYKVNPMTMKVIYKHDVKESLEPTLEHKRLVSNARMNKCSPEEKVDKHYPVDFSIFKHKKVLIVGGESRHTNYIDVFDSLKIELETISGNEGEKRLSPSINRADIVVIVIGEASHSASIQTVKLCKEKGVPFATTHENGIQSILLSAEEAIKKGMELDRFNVVSN